MNLDNLFNYCITSDETQNKSIYFVGNVYGNSLFTIAVDTYNNKMYSYSNEWLYLLKVYYPSCTYNNLISQYNSITSKQINNSYEHLNVIPFITSFSNGTAHGYSGLFFMLNNYINNYDVYKNYKILVYENSQQGILDIINHFLNKNIIHKEQVIYISSNIQYLFNSIKFIPNYWHSYPKNLDLELLNKYIIDVNTYLPLQNKNLCIIKSSISNNITPNGVVDNSTIEIFCNKNNLYLIEPTKINEIELINKLNDCKLFITSWGTSFFKNFIYLSEKCEKVIVFIIGDAFTTEFNNTNKHNDLILKYKNASISYHFVDTNLNIDLTTIIK